MSQLAQLSSNNTKLLEALSDFAGDQSEENRVAFFKVLLASELVVLTKLDRTSNTYKWVSYPDLQGRPTLPVFTDSEALFFFQRDAEDYLILPAWEICNIASTNRVQCVILNPEGPSGIQLEKEELDAIGSGRVPVSDTSIHRLQQDKEIYLHAPTRLPSDDFITALRLQLRESKKIHEAVFFEMGNADQQPGLVLGLLFQPGLPPAEMGKQMTLLHQVCSPHIQEEDLLNVMPMTDPEMISRVRVIGNVVYSLTDQYYHD